jgi:hypothetical protein
MTLATTRMPLPPAAVDVTIFSEASPLVQSPDVGPTREEGEHR